MLYFGSLFVATNVGKHIVKRLRASREVKKSEALLGESTDNVELLSKINELLAQKGQASEPMTIKLE